MALFIFCICIIFAATNAASDDDPIYASEEEVGMNEDREVLVKSLNGLKEMKRRFVKMLEEKGPQHESADLRKKIANLDRMIEKSLLQLDEWDHRHEIH